ncbi:terminase large subunit domain-containing protein [Bifidobacterium pullorum]|uniref:terminase large subunit domain-containing protein n=1 Tax=Bifidobacterium pullorum TaxID=78448 RepID=UPI001EF46D6D|nr:terminase family protein [Bifidobacterium pullorum]
MKTSTRRKKSNRSRKFLLRSTARYVIIPKNITTTGWPRIRQTAKAMGVVFDPWQEAVGKLIYAKTSDGLYASGVGGVVLSLPRQVGKTFLLGHAVFADCISSDRPLNVIWTAHHSRTSDETFKSMSNLADTKTVSPYVASVRKANGQQEIRFTNGSRIMFGAREQGFGRGFDAVDEIVFDEAQILTERALDAMVPTTNASPNPLILFIGTPPTPTDPSEVFTHKRQDALAGNVDDTLYVEFSADEDAKPDDRKQWAKANPSYPTRTGDAAILRMLRNLGPDSFRREGLGVWDRQAVTKCAIDADQWERATVPTKPDKPGETITAFALDMPPDRSALAIGACVKYADGTAHIELAEYRDTKTEGMAWAVEWLKERWPRTNAVAIDAMSPALTLLTDLQAAHIKVTVMQTRDTTQACGRLLDMLRDGTLTHLPDADQPQLGTFAHKVITRAVGKGGAFAWQRPSSDIDISPGVACTLALQAAHTTKRRPGRQTKAWH